MFQHLGHFLLFPKGSKRYLLNWIELNWITLNWIHLSWIEITQNVELHFFAHSISFVSISPRVLDLPNQQIIHQQLWFCWFLLYNILVSFSFHTHKCLPPLNRNKLIPTNLIISWHLRNNISSGKQNHQWLGPLKDH